MEHSHYFEIDRAKFCLDVSYVSSLDPPCSPTTITLDEVVRNFYINPHHFAKIVDLRRLSPDELRAVKASCPSIIPQCIVHRGTSGEHVVGTNHVIVIDVDAFTEDDIERAWKSILAECSQFALAIVRSISGKGAHALLLVDDPIKKLEYYDTIVARLKSQGVPVDECHRNSVQALILSSDPSGFFNPRPVPFNGIIANAADSNGSSSAGKSTERNSRRSSDSKQPPAKVRALPFILDNYKLRRNELTSEVELDGRPITDVQINSMVVDLVDAGIIVDTQFVMTVVGSDRVPVYNPLKVFFDKHKHRNVTGTIDRLFACIKSRTGAGLGFPYVSTMGKKWLVKTVAQTQIPVANELNFCLVGKQGIGKTRFLTGLLDEELRPYQAIIPMTKDKDFLVNLSRYILIIDDEFRARKLEDDFFFKSILSQVDVTTRKPYERTNVTLKRIGSFCSTANDVSLLKADNRRLVPILVDSIDWDEFNKIPKGDILVEAYNAFKAGFNYNLTTEELAVLAEVSKEFEVVNVEEELLLSFFPKAAIEAEVEQWLTVGQMLTLIKSNASLSVTPYRLSQVLTRHGYISKFISVHSSKTRDKMSRLRAWGVRDIDLIQTAQLYLAVDNNVRKFRNTY